MAMNCAFSEIYSCICSDQEIALSQIGRRVLVISSAAALAANSVSGNPAETNEPKGTPMIPLKSEFLFTLTGTVATALDIGHTPSGERRFYPVSGGDFEGPRLKGKVLEGGSDAMLVRADGVAQPDVRLILKTDDGQLIFMRYGGMRHGPAEVMERLARGANVEPTEYYFRITPLFETGSPKYEWLNRIVTVGIGNRLANGPIYYVYEIL